MSDSQLAEKSLSFGKLKGYLKGTVAVTIAGLTTAHIVVYTAWIP